MILWGNQMSVQQNPFTHTYGSAGQAYIDMGRADTAINNFNFEKPSEYVYKIVGVRGSGKTVVLSDIIRYYKTPSNVDKGWIVYDLSSARDPLHTLVAYLANEKFSGINKRKININTSAAIGPVGGSISTEKAKDNSYYDDEVELDILLDKAFSKGKKIMLCIDDIAKTDPVVAFCSVYAKYIRAEKPIYLICTGLFSNIESLGRVKNLTFFRRAEIIEVRSLSDVSITLKYKNLLDIEIDEARTLARLTKGYAYAYQVLGSLYFKKGSSETISDLKDAFDERLFSQSYEKIWEELSAGERSLVIILINHKRREEILKHMEKPNNYSEYRNSLIKGGIIRDTKRGEVEFSLPDFEEYVEIFCL